MNRGTRDAAVLLALLVPIAAVFALGSRPRVDPVVKMGPNTGVYLEGFARDYEIAGLHATRWTSHLSAVRPPLELRRGPLELSYRCARVLAQSANLEVRLGGRTVDALFVRGGAWHVRRVPLAGAGSDLGVVLDVDGNDNEDLGVSLDWVRWSVGEGGRIAIGRGVVLRLATLVAVFFVALRMAGHGTAWAGALAGAVSLVSAAWAVVDPYALAHVVLRVALPAALLSAAVLAATWRTDARRWLLAIVVIGYLVKGAGWFHPRAFYQDVRNAERYVTALKQETGPIAERTVRAQVKTDVGYPRFVAGRPYAFPYSPLMFLPLGLLPDADAIETGFRHLGLLAAGLEPLLAFALSRVLLPSSAAVPAALLAAFVPPIFSRLLIAMAATLVGHVWDAALGIALVRYLRTPTAKALALVGACALGSQLLYVSSLFTVGSLVALAAAWAPRHALRLLAVLAVTSLVTVAWLYGPFTAAFVTEILPAVMRGLPGPGATSHAAPGGPLAALGRVPLFYGWAYPALAVAGFVILRRTGDDAARRLASAWASAFLLLVALRAFGGGLFRDLKEITFVAPLVVVLAGLAVEEIARRRRAAAALVLAGLVAYGLGRYAAWIEEYRSPFTQAAERP